MERRLGEFLRAMREPVLSPSTLSPFRRRFRLVTLPDMHGNYRALRIDERQAGGARVRFVELSRGPRYGPGSIVRERIYDIDRDAVLELNRALELSRVSELPSEGPPLYPPAEAPGEETVITICLHPTTFVFELIELRRRTFVVRTSCDMTDSLWRLLETVQPLRQV